MNSRFRNKCIVLLVFWGLFAQKHAAQATAPVRQQRPPRKAGRLKQSFGNIVPATIEEQEKQEKRRLEALEMDMQRAWMYSAMAPGLGQLYNKQYWRIPVIYAVLAGLGGCAIYYHQEYLESKRKLIRGENISTAYVNYVDFCRSAQDVFVGLAALWYVANIFDAYVGASLQTFDVSDDIGLKVQPAVVPTASNQPTLGLSLTLRL